MSALSEAVGNNAPGHVLEHGGRIYTAAAIIDQTMQVAWERWMYGRHRAAAREEALEDGVEVSERTLEKLRRKFLLGHFRLLSPLGLRMLRDRQGAGLLKLTALIFDTTETEALALIGARSVEVVDLVRTVLAASFPGIDFSGPEKNGKPAAVPDPNASAVRHIP